MSDGGAERLRSVGQLATGEETMRREEQVQLTWTGQIGEAHYLAQQIRG